MASQEQLIAEAMDRMNQLGFLGQVNSILSAEQPEGLVYRNPVTSIRADRPGATFEMPDWVMNSLISQEGRDESYGLAELARDIAPVTGEIQAYKDAKDYLANTYQAAAQGDDASKWVNAAMTSLSGLGMLPLAGTFVSKASKAADLKKLLLAQELAARGVDPDKIWKRTLWADTPGGWRTEVSDRGLEVIGGRIDHPALAEHVPGIKDINVLGQSDFTPYVNDMPISGQYIPSQDAIQLYKSDNPTATLVHELQHAVQHKLDMPGGGSPSIELATDATKAQQARLKEQIENLLESNPDLKKAIDQETDYIKKLTDKYGFYYYEGMTAREKAKEKKLMDAMFEHPKYQELSTLKSRFQNEGVDMFDAYQRLWGEQEARTAGARALYPLEERLEKFPFDYLANDRDKYFLKRGETAASINIDPNSAILRAAQSPIKAVKKGMERLVEPIPDDAVKVDFSPQARAQPKVVPLDMFNYGDPADDFVYHITSQPNADKILKEGFIPGKNPMFSAGVYPEYSKGKVFFTDRGGAKEWADKIEESLFHAYDDPPAVSVIQVPRANLKLLPDDLGSKDVRGGKSYYITGDDINPEARQSALAAAFKRLANDESGAIDPELLGLINNKTWYHGTQRLDRLTESGKLSKKRATSGPMNYFTDEPNIASNYATGKVDTSRLDEGTDYAQWFRLPISKKKTVDLDQAWYHLPREKRAEITEKLDKLGMTEQGEIAFGAPLAGKDHWDYELKQARGNAIKAAKEVWLNSGVLYDQEEKFIEVLNKLGLNNIIDDSPWKTAPGILPAKIRTQNPLDTNDVESLRALLPELEKRARKQPIPKYDYGVDAWDKRAVHPIKWVERLKEDLDKGTTLTWTTIPDWVTRFLKSKGYDGVIDRGGKMGGPGHNVLIPFEPNQVRVPWAKFDPAKKDSSDLLASLAMAALTGGAVAANQE